MSREKLIVILGPTAVGKTRLSIDLAARMHTDILSGDSMLVYKGFNIGTAKPTAEEQAGVKHFLIDILPAEASFNVMDFQARAVECIRKLNTCGCIPILAGGTGLYIKSLIEGYRFNTAPGNAAYRQELEHLAVEKGKGYVHAMLAQVDPAAASRLHVNDFRRVIRALEVCHFGRETISQDKQQAADLLAYDVYVVGLCRARAELYERINARVDAMFAAGLEDEVSGLLRAGVPRTAQAMQGIGYKETAAYLCGEITRDSAIGQIKKSTRNFAKRQLTWYRKMPYAHWYDVGTMPEKSLLEMVYNDIAGYFAAKGEF